MKLRWRKYWAIFGATSNSWKESFFLCLELMGPVYIISNCDLSKWAKFSLIFMMMFCFICFWLVATFSRIICTAFWPNATQQNTNPAKPSQAKPNRTEPIRTIYTWIDFVRPASSTLCSCLCVCEPCITGPSCFIFVFILHAWRNKGKLLLIMYKFSMFDDVRSYFPHFLD